ncbi:MAG TPA: hypothetical protein VFJ97_08310 [Dermatophilaceae bacterium]|nr:hypothetical protein [Dermatophilaceae bacterium]
MSRLDLAVSLAVIVVLVAWYLSYSAARLDRLHTRVEGALAALDAQLVRRAEVTLELAGAGILDPASSLLLADAAAEALEAADEPHAARERVESDLTQALELALSPEAMAGLGPPGREALERVAAANQRVQLARRFHNDAVTDVRRVRRKRTVRMFRLAGHADLPSTFEIDDELPGLERAA